MKSESLSTDPQRWLNRTNSNDINTEKTWESSTKNGLNKTSGTLELNIWTGTSWQQTEDFVCWAKDELSETEKTRLEAHRNDWSGECIKNASILQNKSLARLPLTIDTNISHDFFQHFNGSPEEENFSQNSPPIPKILVQGGKRIYETSLNLTGLDGENATTDPNGIHDLKSWKWEIDGKTCGDYEIDHWEWSNVKKGEKTCEEESHRDNPGLIYFDFNAQEKFQITLTVEDLSGEKGITTAELDRDPFNVGGGSSVFSAPLKKWLAKEFEKESPNERKRKKLSKSYETHADFFVEFVQQLDYTKINLQQKQQPSSQKTQLPRRMRERIPPSQLLVARKNLGLVFLY